MLIWTSFGSDFGSNNDLIHQDIEQSKNELLQWEESVQKLSMTAHAIAHYPSSWLFQRAETPVEFQQPWRLYSFLQDRIWRFMRYLD